jgi:predicted metal-dependent hydrolase
MPPRSSPAKLVVDSIEIAVVRRRMRRLRLVVRPPDGHVVISAPQWVARRELEAFATAKVAWIHAQKARIRALPPAPSLDYRSGEHHPVWGRPCTLDVIAGTRRARVTIDGDRLLLAIAADADRSARFRALEAWHRDEAAQAIGPLVAAWEPTLGVEVAGWSVRRMKTRWGSCTPRTRRLRFNSELAKRRPELLEYVVVHEMAHIVEPSHNARFKTLLTAHMPDWRERHAELAARPIDRAPADF